MTKEIIIFAKLRCLPPQGCILSLNPSTMNNLHILAALIVSLALAAVCSCTGRRSENIYYVAVHDGSARHYAFRYPVHKTVEAWSAGAAVTDALFDIDSLLLDRASLVKESDRGYFRLEPHSYRIFVWDSEGNHVAVDPSVVESFVGNDSLINLLWAHYPEALSYYREYTNFFDIPTNMLSVNDLDIALAEKRLNPSSWIKMRRDRIEVDELSNNKLAEVTFYAVVAIIIAALVIRSRRKEQREERERLKVLRKGITINLTIDTHPAGPQGGDDHHRAVNQ